MTAAAPRARGLAGIVGEFTAARWRARTGDGILTVLSAAAFAVVTLIANIVASGTWMFVERRNHPPALLAAVLAEDPTLRFVLDFYVVLAVIACALLVAPVVGLAASATLLGARARERRLATLRLLGVTRAEVSLMGVLDVTAQAAAGAVVGGALTVLAMPPLSRLSFQAVPVRYEEMLMPWWAYLLVAAAVVAVATAAAAVSLVRVRISPLGVTRRATPKALRAWRLLLLAAMIGVFATAPTWAPDAPKSRGGLVMGALVVAFLLAVDVAMPYIVQAASRLLARLPWTTPAWAARRVALDPAPTWRRIGGIGTLILLAAFFGGMPIGVAEDLRGAQRTLAEAVLPDIRTGFLLTIGFAFALAAVSAMVNQASAEFERADETRALARMGVSPRRALAVSWTEALGPLAGTSILSLGLGLLLGAPFTRMAHEAIDEAGGVTDLEQLAGAPLMATIVAAGLAAMVLALAAAVPIHRRIVADDRRR